jgi:hypothetical protein
LLSLLPFALMIVIVVHVAAVVRREKPKPWVTGQDPLTPWPRRQPDASDGDYAF